jgi:hypothetical protein
MAAEGGREVAWKGRGMPEIKRISRDEIMGLAEELYLRNSECNLENLIDAITALIRERDQAVEDLQCLRDRYD